MKKLYWLGLMLLILQTLAPSFSHQAVQAQAGTAIPVTFTITRVQERHCDEDPSEGCPNDYYPRFNIDNQGLFDGKELFCCEDLRDFPPNWAHMRTVDSSHNPVPIHIELWDQDDLSDDDIVDIAAGDPRSLDLTFDLNTCTFQGGGLTAQQGAGIPGLLQGQSLGGSNESADITFTITTPFCLAQSYQTDSDGDGLFDGWETMGLDIEDPNVQLAKVLPVVDGAADLVLNTNPLHKDIFVEVDWMQDSTHSHKPVDGVLADVIKAFAEAPVMNPDNTTGITLHLLADEALPDQPNILFRSGGPGLTDDFNDIKLGITPGNRNLECLTGRFGTAADRADGNCAKILAAKRVVYRYMVFAHSYAEAPGSSGQAEIGGNDFIVTLGPPGAFTAAQITAAGGQRIAEASTFMHELGHTLGLRHGGGDDFNCKPNYLSVMNYTLQFPNIDNGRPLDYTSASKGTALGALDENGRLDETKGIGGPAGRLTVYGVGGKQRTRPANTAPIDWNEANGIENAASADINYIDTITPTSESGGCGTPSLNQPLNGFDDWAQLDFNFRDSPDFADGVRGSLIPELTGEQVVAMSARADLKLVKSVDKTTAIGGDTLNYNVTATNVGRGKAINIILTDTLPDGSTQTRFLPELEPGAANTQPFTFPVSCAATDGAVFTNQAAVTATDEGGIPDPDLADNQAQATTTVQTPILQLAKSAPAAVNAGEAIVYTITYENSGSGAASNVLIADILPAEVYYSPALDLGAGPKPTAVTLNADGTRTLVWQIASLPGNSGPQTIVFMARPTLLAAGGAAYSNQVSLNFQNGNGCVYAPVNATAATNITVTPPTRDPATLGFWRNHAELWTAEILARIQATDQRYDSNGDGVLAVAEATAMLAPGGNQPKVLQMQLLATYFNLATRRINADTAIRSTTAESLGLVNVRAAAIFAIGTLLLPVEPTNAARYDNSTRVLDEMNNNKSEVY